MDGNQRPEARDAYESDSERLADEMTRVQELLGELERESGAESASPSAVDAPAPAGGPASSFADPWSARRPTPAKKPWWKAW